MMNTGRFLSIALVTLLLSNCSLQSNEETAAQIARQAASRSERFPGMNDAAEAKLVEAASSVSKSLNQLADIESAMYPSLKLPRPENPADIGMEDLASVDWNGPAEPLMQKIAQASHYQFRALGPKPAIPVIISVTRNNEPIANILRDVTYQVAKQATVVVYPGSHLIELRYIR